MLVDSEDTWRQRELCLEEDREREGRDAEESRKNSNFIQLYKNNLKASRELTLEDPLAMALLLFFYEHMNAHNSIACSYKVLGEVFGKSRTSLWRSVSRLVDKDFIAVTKMGNVNVYHINTEIAWSTWKNQKQYAAFSAQIIVAKSEQDEPKPKRMNVVE